MCSEGIKAEAGNNDACEGCESRVRDLSTGRHDEKDPRLRVLHCLHGLVFREMPVLDSLLVACYPVNCNQAFGFGQELRCAGQIWQYNERHDAPGDR